MAVNRRHGTFLPDDLAKEILLLLPARSLVKFKCVSKLWFSLISDPAFITSHTKQSSTSPSTLFIFNLPYMSAIYLYDYALHTDRILFLRELFPGYFNDGNEKDDDDDLYRTIPPVDDDDDLYRMTPSVDGLLLLYNRKTIYVCNPCTREIVSVLPEKNVEVDQTGHSQQDLFSHTMEFCVDNLGFGVDPSTGKYKVVLITSTGCHIFTQGSQSWGRIPLPDFLSFEFVRIDPVSINGVLYWDTVDMYDNRSGWIICFDLSTENFGLFQSPPVTEYDNRTAECLQGEPCIVDCTAKEGFDIVIWTRKQDCWSQSYRIRSNEIAGQDARVLAIHNGSFLIATDKDLYSYKLNGKNELCNHGWGEHKKKNSIESLNAIQCINGALFTESLAPVR